MQTPAPPRSTRLKRRAGGASAAESLESQLFSPTIDEPKELPLKKFKALFDATDPDKVESTMALDDDESAPYSQTQGETQSGQTGRRSARGMTGTSLGVLREEEEETQTAAARPESSATAFSGRSLKRKATSSQDDVEMAGVEDALAPSPLEATESGLVDRPAAKKRAIEDVNAVQPVGKPVSKAATAANLKKTDTTKKAGAAPGKPETDDAFLKALASKKKGKRAEDDFDRDFNKLKISKPVLGRDDEPEKDWKLVEDFGEDKDLRKNMMLIVEMTIFKTTSRQKENKSRAEWQGLPNFKKFKKVRPSFSLKLSLSISDFTIDQESCT